MGSKSSRHISDNSESLSRETIDELCQDTGFTEEELLKWHTNFYKDCPDGKLTLKQFEHEYSKIMGKPTQKTSDYVKHMFNVYDQDKNQFIDFREFVMALSAASYVNRLRLVETLFSVFDLDTDGKISKEEMGTMLHTLMEVTTANRKHRNQHHHRSDEETKQINLQKRLDDAFNELNTNDDDFITKDEFIDWYIKSGLLSDVKSNEINVPSTTRIQQIDKQNRKKKKLNHKDDLVHTQLRRYMSRMKEEKLVTNLDDEVDEEKHPSDLTLSAKASSDDTDSDESIENERWQYLFNSVLQQIRAQRLHGYENESTNSDQFHSWKQQGEEKLKLEYYRQKSNELPQSPEIVRIRL